MYKLSYYEPESHLEITKQAIFDAGAGRGGTYDSCCWQVRGEGQFRPLPGSRPFIGQEGTIEQVEEYRVEMVCTDDRIAEVIVALQHAHPFEEPAYNVVNLAEF